MKYWDQVKNILPSFGNVLAMILIVLFLGALIVGVPKLFGPLPAGEIQIGLVVVLAIAALLILMTVMAAAYSRLGLASSNQALGLPEGSIRALIALFLIMIFIIMGVYLFRVVSGSEEVPLRNLTDAQVAQLGRQLIRATRNEAGTYDVLIRGGVDETAQQLALQLATILGTLVTAVSAFYFGSSTANSAARPVMQPSSTQVSLRVTSITPSKASVTASPVHVEIAGSGFVGGAKVSLTSGGKIDIAGSNVSVMNSSIITCTFDLNDRPKGVWDVVVANADGSRAIGAGLFEIE